MSPRPEIAELLAQAEAARAEARSLCDGLSAEQRAALTDLVVKTTKHKSWQEALDKNGWTAAVLAGKDFVDYEFTSLRAIMYLSGML